MAGSAGGGKESYTMMSRLSKARAKEYTIVDSYKLAYRNREDITNLPPGVLIVGSHDCLTNVSNRVQIRQGYQLDGPVSQVNTSVASSFDWLTRGNGEVHLRAGGITNKDTTALFASATSTTITVQGTTSLAALGFTSSGNITIGTMIYTYTGLSAQTFTGVTSQPFQGDIGTISTTAMATGVNGTGTFFTSTFQVGDTISANGETHTITVIGSDTSITTDAWTNNNTNVPYTGGIPAIPVGKLISQNAGVMQFRYVDSSGNVTWPNLLTGLQSTAFNFDAWWNSTEALRECLMVNGASQITQWNGATAILASTTTGTITKTGTQSWADAGFYVATSGRSIVINGNTYSYTGGENTTTLTGVGHNPTGEANGSVIHQAPIVNLNLNFTMGTGKSGLPPVTFANGLIAVLNNQIYLAALNNSTVWISNVNSFTDYSSSTPRQAGEGGSLILDDQVVGFVPQEKYMYVSAGRDLWYNIGYTQYSTLSSSSSVAKTFEQINCLPLKTGNQQGAISQPFISHMKNDVITVTNETTIDMVGRMENYYETPQTKNISDSIKIDVDSYNFTGGSIFYWRWYILVALPAQGLVLIYDLSINAWQPPQTLPITRFYIVNGVLYGHSSSSLESYQLFVGTADRVYPSQGELAASNGHPISMVAKFSYQNYGSRFMLKNSTAFYVEGYIGPNTTLNATLNYELDGCAITRTLELNGNNGQYVCIPPPAGSLGSESLGKIKLGGQQAGGINGLPPKFRWIPTFNPQDYFEVSPEFSCSGVNQAVQILAFGLNGGGSTQEPVSKKN